MKEGRDIQHISVGLHMYLATHIFNSKADSPLALYLISLDLVHLIGDHEVDLVYLRGEGA